MNLQDYKIDSRLNNKVIAFNTPTFTNLEDLLNQFFYTTAGLNSAINRLNFLLSNWGSKDSIIDSEYGGYWDWEILNENKLTGGNYFTFFANIEIHVYINTDNQMIYIDSVILPPRPVVIMPIIEFVDVLEQWRELKSFMNCIHFNYNLKFVNKIFEDRNFKEVNFINTSDKTYTPILFYLNQILYKDFIEDVLIEINNALAEKPFNDGIEIGSERITLTISNVEIRDQCYVNNIPTLDFKNILEEYKDFLETPPLSNSSNKSSLMNWLEKVSDVLKTIMTNLKKKF